MSGIKEQQGTERDLRAIAADQRANSIPTFEHCKDGSVEMHIRDNGATQKAYGYTTPQFLDALAASWVNVSGKLEGAAEDKNRAVAIVAEIEPRDGIEAMLATQMAAVHIALSRHSRLMAQADTIERLDIHERTFNKLARTFTSQMEALRKHRNGGKQTVTVQHVNVEGGGQAIVGDVHHQGGG